MNFLTKFPIGQYVHGDKSWLRVIDSRLKIILLSIFLITPILAGPFWRLTLVVCLIFITFSSLLPIRVWWRSFVLVSILSLFLGILSTFVAANIPSLDIPIRDPYELDVLLNNKNNWNLIELNSFQIGLLKLGSYSLSFKAFELGIKTSTLIFTVIHSVNLILITTLKEDLVWALSWYLKPLRRLNLPVDRWLFQLLLSLRFIPLVQEELQNILKSASVRSINFRKLGFKKSINTLFDIIERLFLNILLRTDQGADSLLAKGSFSLQISRYNSIKRPRILSIIFNTISICFIFVAIFLRKQYGAL